MASYDAALTKIYEERLTSFYRKYDPSKIASVGSLLVKYKGNEEKLLRAMVSKYGPEPTPDELADDDDEDDGDDDDGDDDDDDDEPRDDGAPAARAPGLYWDDPKDYGYGLYDGTTVSSGRARIIAPRDAADRDRHEEFHQQTASSATAQTDDDAAAADGREKRRRIDEKAATPRVQADDAPPKPAGRELSREEKRRIELKVLELRDELEEDEALDEAAVDARCDALRATLTAAAEGPPPSRASGSSSEEVGIAIDFDDEDDD
mmetsp:Transcript_3546/g.13753  ORF Transcript_3546/g.13753 Transcript_3546/m.13753 type:complete len:263 (-) Transcript_3546:878-1666(-)